MDGPRLAGEPADEPNSFARWLNVTMQQQGISQAALARDLGVADTQVSRWRRGQVVPTLRYLQQIADTFGVQRALLDHLAGYPVAAAAAGLAPAPHDPATLADLQAYQARYRRLLEERVPPALWGAYIGACEALAETLRTAYEQAVAQAAAPHARGVGDSAPARPLSPMEKDDHPLGFRRHPAAGG